MPLRKCDLCNKIFNQKSHYDNHIKRKIKCVSINQNNNIENDYNNLKKELEEKNNIIREYESKQKQLEKEINEQKDKLISILE